MKPEKTKQVIKALKNLAAAGKHLSINQLRVVVAIERAIARLAASKLAPHLIFKGGYVLFKSFDSQRSSIAATPILARKMFTILSS